ncbi:hypothetical protein [Parasedimentitalea maritima]|uniref:Rubrerythrin n=1 Tax=Parasedimentitalea maritima TaxID=2578117 RepID=A0A6A4R9U2_9RHOB|nr:hypothetical protein [Zongyanglinia marina]KAE9624739.1 hypothetical protein GP644_23175 [Zongyanglinia marina]
MQKNSVVQRLREQAITWITPIFWRNSDRRLALALNNFSRVEYDSGWQALRVMSVRNDPEHQAELLLTALEEFHHSALFRRLAEKQKLQAPNLTVQRQSIWDETPEIDHFLAAQFIGETSVHNEFMIYEKATGNCEISSTFRDICLDEAKHVKDAYTNLVVNIGSEDKARRLIRQVRRGHDWRALSKALEPIGATVSNLLVLLVYFGIGLFLWPFARHRLQRS